MDGFHFQTYFLGYGKKNLINLKNGKNVNLLVKTYYYYYSNIYSNIFENKVFRTLYEPSIRFFPTNFFIMYYLNNIVQNCIFPQGKFVDLYDNDPEMNQRTITNETRVKLDILNAFSGPILPL